jgi:hypothetical protein
MTFPMTTRSQGKMNQPMIKRPMVNNRTDPELGYLLIPVLTTSGSASRSRMPTSTRRS